jgi:hypothetical protein
VGKRLLYWLLGFAVGVIALLPIELLRGKYSIFWSILIGLTWGNASLGIAQRRGKVKPPEPPAPLTLFPRDTQ